MRLSEKSFRGAATGLWLLNSAVLTVEILGLIGFALHLKSGLWEIWNLFFLMGTIGVFKVFPIIGIGLFVWWKVGQHRFAYSATSWPIIVKYSSINTLCVSLYFLVEWITTKM